MKNPFLSAAIAMLLILFVSPLPSNAESNLNTREEVLEFLGEAFDAQVSLNEKTREMEEIHETLHPYFTENYEKLFLDENLYSENGKYIVYGSDFSPYFVPFFQFSDKTKIVFDDKKIYVFEHFAASTDGPVTYKSHYEGLLLAKEEGSWKVAEYIYDEIPKEIIDRTKNKKAVKKASTKEDVSFVNESSQMLLSTIKPFEALITYGTLLLNGVTIPLR